MNQPLPLCWRTKSQMFKRRQHAQRALAQSVKLVGLSPDNAPNSVYHCDACRCWHLTALTSAELKQLKDVRRLFKNGRAEKREGAEA